VTAVQNAAVVGPDPRPVVQERPGHEFGLLGSRCTACGYPLAEVLERCPVCGGACAPVSFGPAAVVFAATVLRVAVPGRTPPYGLAYVDLVDGPRILAHVRRTDVALAPGDIVHLAGTTDDGDPLVGDGPSGRGGASERRGEAT